MNKYKSLKKTIILSVSSLVVSLSLPLGWAHAASVNETAYTPDLLKALFNQFGISYSHTGIYHNQIDNFYSRPAAPAPSKPVQKPAAPEQNEIRTVPKGEQSSARLALAAKIIATGEKYMGTPYKFGSPSGSTRTFDCSSFVQYVYGVHGIKLPRSSRQQATVGKTVPRSQIQKGDLLFFTSSHSGGRIGHVAIYAGNNKVLHTWGPGGVRYDSLSAGWLREGYVTAKRVIPE